ncbi:hypothetical protein ACJZ2D_007795 [Fusarium nematophilum]
MASSDLACALQIDTHRMPHEAYIRRDGEDWAGMTNQKERKKLQNRLNQRARRSRKTQCQAKTGTSRVLVPRPCLAVQAAGDGDAVFGWCTEENLEEKRALLGRFAQQALASYTKSQPTADHLLKLIQLNVINSLTRNSAILGMNGDWLLCSATSPFYSFGPTYSPATTLPAHYPDNLAPTSLQKRIPHHPWVDLFPLPKMRDNFLVAITSSFSQEEEQRLWDDLIEAGGQKDWTGMIVWGEPWDPKNWEVTVPFLQRWGWLLDGCPQILKSTNLWRRKRGEKPLALHALKLQDQRQQGMSIIRSPLSPASVDVGGD